jgi:aminobenzoyl-glutamate transport protein
MTSLGSYIVLVFFAAQFVKFFEWTNLGTLLAVSGAQVIKDLGMDNPGIFIVFILVCASVNLVMGSASAKWTFMAPVFVPMMMQLGYSPELIQCAYRIGDSCTNVISPMMSYFGMIFVFACRYDRRFGMGSIISLMFPYSVLFLITWTIFFYLWVFVFQLPIGPNTPLFLETTGPQ